MSFAPEQYARYQLANHIEALKFHKIVPSSVNAGKFSGSEHVGLGSSKTFSSMTSLEQMVN